MTVRDLRQRSECAECPFEIGLKIFDGFVEFTVVDTPEYKKGDQKDARPKNAVLDTGVNIKVPTYVDKGDRILVDIRKEPPAFEKRVEE